MSDKHDWLDAAKRPSAVARREAHCRESAARFFCNHIVEVELDAPTVGDSRCRIFRFRDPDKGGIDAVRIIEHGCSLFLSGDHGVCVWTRCPDMLTWMRGSIDSLGYFAEKVERECLVQEFDPAVVGDWVKERDTDFLTGERDGEDLDEWHDLRRKIFSALGDGNEQAVRDAISDADWCDEQPDFDNYTVRFFMQREALRWFFHRHFGDPEPCPKSTSGSAAA